ncbi:MAG TPA: hypothetical protein IAA95_03290 [Candidatus Aveggerthella excrementigallinarum]|nr:hypothetical protein [Candidatus Aveggerthella excrementigallinarum]
MDTEFVVSTAVDVLAAVAACAAIYVALYVSYRAELPDIVAYLEHDLDKAKIDLVVANLGKGVARNVEFKGVKKCLAQPSLQEPFSRSFVFGHTGTCSRSFEKDNACCWWKNDGHV